MYLVHGYPIHGALGGKEDLANGLDMSHLALFQGKKLRDRSFRISYYIEDCPYHEQENIFPLDNAKYFLCI